MAPFLRIAFNSYDLGTLTPSADPPFCAIKMKEALTTGGEFVLQYTFLLFVLSYFLFLRMQKNTFFPFLSVSNFI